MILFKKYELIFRKIDKNLNDLIPSAKTVERINEAFYQLMLDEMNVHKEKAIQEVLKEQPS